MDLDKYFLLVIKHQSPEQLEKFFGEFAISSKLGSQGIATLRSMYDKYHNDATKQDQIEPAGEQQIDAVVATNDTGVLQDSRRGRPAKYVR